MEIIAKGAEAIIFNKESDLVIKRRIEKGYRIKQIDDKLRKLRTRQEARLLEKAATVANVPKVISVDEKTKEVTIEFLHGQKLSETLNDLEKEKQEEICKKIGEQIAKLHDKDIIHGDLTTSNMILKDDKVFFIDFGLGFHSKREEDKAVDLHLIKQALEAKHFQNSEMLFFKLLEGYQTSENADPILHQLVKVEARGRYKH